MADDSDLGVQDLPDEVLTEILARLPAKSAGRFRCVSRGWSAMLSSDYFVDLHARRANRPDRPRFLLTAVGSSYDGYLNSWQPGGAVDKLMLDEFGGWETVPLTKPCGGLVLLRCTDSGYYYAFNPSTGEAVALPDSEKPLMMRFGRSRWHNPKLPFYLRVSYGLGYCRMRKEYKVVRLFSNPEPEDGDYDFAPARTEVFVLNGPGYWRPSAENPPVCYVMENPAVFSNGYLHFLCFDGGITTFSISNETFGSLLPPPGYKNMESVMTELDGCLCLCYGEPGSEDPLHVCVLRDYELATWEKLCCVDRTAWSESDRILLNSLWIAPIGMYYSGGGKKIMFTTGSCKVFAVDPDGGDPEILFTPDDTIVGSCNDDVPAFTLLEESLVPVGCTVEDMVFSLPTTEAWFEILKWLPTRSVLELRLVCREWRGMLMSDCFTQSHAIHANLKRSPQIMFAVDTRFGFYVDMEQWMTIQNGVRPGYDLVCSQPCHGLNVGSWSSYDFVCNPAMCYSEHIEFDDNDGTFFAGCIGLGYNTEIDKHVMVHITYKEKNLKTRYYELQCKMKYVHACEWDSIDPPSRPVAGIPPNFFNGKIYWMVDPNLGPVSERHEIVAFNVETQEFEVLQGPPSTHGSGHMAILELQGALCISYSDQSKNTIDLWMMKDDGTWLIEYHIVLDRLAENAAPLAFDPSDGRILINTGWSLGYYDPRTAAFETIYTNGLGSKFHPIVCHESLVCPLH